MLKVNQIKRRDLISLLLILFVAAMMHLGEPDVVEFFHDEAMVSILAQEMAHGEAFPTRGIVSSVGIPNPPTSIWVMGWIPKTLQPTTGRRDPVVSHGRSTATPWATWIWSLPRRDPAPDAAPYALRISPLVGTPVPAVTSTWSTSGTGFTEVPRTWRTASAMPFMPWMYASPS